jgi:hypothetical protein
LDNYCRRGKRTALSVVDSIYDRTATVADASLTRESFERAGGTLVRLPGTAREAELSVSSSTRLLGVG